MSDEAKPVLAEAQPTAAKQAEREQMVAGARRLEAAFRAERDAEQAARAERESGVAAPVATTPTAKQPTAPKPAAPASTVEERRAKREEPRREVEQYRRQAEQIAAYAREREPSAQKWEAIQQAHARGDFESVARLLGADSWNSVQDHYVRVLADPNHLRLMEIERQVAAEQRAAQERAQAQQRQQREAAIEQLKTGVRERMKASSHPVLANFHDNPHVYEPLWATIVRHYERTGEDLSGSPERALQLQQPNGLTLLEGLESYATFGDRYRAAKSPKAATAEQPRAKPAPKPKAEPEQRWGWQPSKKRDEDAAWRARGVRDLERAFGEERRRERR